MTAKAVGKTRAQRATPLHTAAPAADCQPGRAWPLGATPRDGGVNFAVFASGVDRVEVCVFDATGIREERRITLPGHSDDIWHGFVEGLAPGTLYGLRVYGPYDPQNGWRCNPHKLLLDPYARKLDRPLRGAAWQYAYTLGHDKRDLIADPADNARDAAKCVVVDPAFDWGDDRHPATPMEESVFYEVHVRGFTKQMPEVPEPLRGTFAGLATEPAIAHLKALGVTAVELLPVQAFNDERRLIDMGLANYWGYNTIAFFAPEPRYLAGNDIDEFRAMVKALHAAGLEVILDVAYNHSCEGNHLGPTLSFKGIDNRSYYRLTEDHRHYLDYTGTGNTLNASHPAMLRLVLDSLRSWVEEMHVDGFRFDLAPAIARNANGGFDHRGPFLSAVAQDPVLQRVKLIAEPWDLGPHGYQVGGFPLGWSEWNGQYRDRVRDYWRGTEGSLPDFAHALCGSADIYSHSRRRPAAGVNIITVHDGFTLNDLVTYNDKHNESNAEDNRDGESHNRSWNCGAEGPTQDPEIRAFRARQKRNFLTTLFASRGVPLLLGGDEMGRTQGGNNNAYCQDNEVSWFDWGEHHRNHPLLAFTQSLVRLRRELPVLRRNAWLGGVPDAQGRRDVSWYSVWGLPMLEDEWTNPAVRSVAAVLDARFAPSDLPTSRSVMLVFNATGEDVLFTLPRVPGHEDAWAVRIYTAEGHFAEADAPLHAPGGKIELLSHSMALLTQAPQE
ncbi:MAG: glycogen debranching protein GlgX [Ramlibacter sp.]